MMNGRNPAAKAIADWMDITFTLVRQVSNQGTKYSIQKIYFIYWAFRFHTYKKCISKMTNFMEMIPKRHRSFNKL